MDNNLPTQPKNNQLTKKLIVLALLIGVSWIATMFVWNIVQERESSQQGTASLISEQWSRPQLIAGPVLTIPMEKTIITTTGEKLITNDTLTLLPKNLTYTSDIKSQILTRGIYEAPVYTSIINGSGSFDLSVINLQPSENIKLLWGKAIVSINISDTRGIDSNLSIDWNNKSYPLLPSSKFSTLDENGVHAPIVIDGTNSTYPFTFTLPLKGSREISFLPLSENTEVNLTSDWSTPSFTGEFLPKERNITEAGFSATWNITSYGKNTPEYWLNNLNSVTRDFFAQKTFGVGLFQEVDFYTMIDRIMKYSILFISLTFLTFFMYELLAGLRIHPMQYLLVGLAIALFYLLLLSFAEIVGFQIAYLISTIATTILITGYCFSVLKAKKRAFSITALLIALYGYLYILLQLEQFSLLFGSVLLFGVLAAVMYLTRNLDWYTLNNKE